jgi:hypothetical protein
MERIAADLGAYCFGPLPDLPLCVDDPPDYELGFIEVENTKVIGTVHGGAGTTEKFVVAAKANLRRVFGSYTCRGAASIIEGLFPFCLR